MRILIQSCIFLLFVLPSTLSMAQEVIQNYEPAKLDSLQIGPGEHDFLPYIQKGFTLMLPKDEPVKGVLLFLEDSGYDDKNKNARQMYEIAAKEGFALLSISSEIPFDFYFTDRSLLSTHSIITNVFRKYNLPNKNIFFLGASLVGHRAMRYIHYVQHNNPKFQLNIRGIVLCNFTLDWTRKWHQHARDIKINRIDLWEPQFMNYMLETYLGGTPHTVPERYHEFSTYSYTDDQQRNIAMFKNYAIRAYIKPDIKYRLQTYYRTMYENNSTDIIGFLAEQKLGGNEETELVVMNSNEDLSQKRNSQTTWNSVNKEELLAWILKQTME